MSNFIDLEWTSVYAISKRVMGRMRKNAMRTIAIFWWKRYAPIHFTKRAYRRYGYAPRMGDIGSGRRFRGSYQERKLREHGHTRPLEFEGEAKGATLNTPKINASKNVATKTTSRKFNYKHPKSKVRMVDEIRAHTLAELAAEREAANDRLLSQMRRYNRREGISLR